jgi:hypothetical protein
VLVRNKWIETEWSVPELRIRLGERAIRAQARAPEAKRGRAGRPDSSPGVGSQKPHVRRNDST